MAPAIRVEGLSKKYRIGTRPNGEYATLRESVSQFARNSLSRFRRRESAAPDEFWALKDVSFDVQPGEVIGIIGRNGAGKSTLLKILSRITEPTSGRATLRGRVASLLEVGTGFHPELTGRENIFLNGSILGMTKSEIKRDFDGIADFAGIGQFLDTPVKRYSSGMYVRLAFAIAAHLEPEILIVDEVLAVGDAKFQEKCLSKMQEVSSGGRAVLFVSHNTAAVETLCGRTALFNDGRLMLFGESSEVISSYLQHGQDCCQSNIDLATHANRRRSSIPSMKRISFHSDVSTPGVVLRTGDTLGFTVFAEMPFQTNSLAFGFVVKTDRGQPIFCNNTKITPPPCIPEISRFASIRCSISSLPLLPGKYVLDLYLGSHGHDFDVIDNAAAVVVASSNVTNSGVLPHSSCGHVYVPVAWQVDACQHFNDYPDFAPTR